MFQTKSAPQQTFERPSLFGAYTPSATSTRVAKYFETSGFSRWSAIYGEGDIPPIWRVIRDGHGKSVEQVLAWIGGDNHRTALDAGCGTGNLAVQLSRGGYEVDAFDISAPMIHFARYINSGRTRGIPPAFQVGDIGALSDAEPTYDLVVCLDVLFHYPYDEVRPMLEKLASLSAHKLVGSFALRTGFNAFWMYVGKKYFHKKNRMTNLHLLSYNQVEQILYRCGFKITNTKRVKFFFYDSFVFEAVRR